MTDTRNPHTTLFLSPRLRRLARRHFRRMPEGNRRREHDPQSRRDGDDEKTAREVSRETADTAGSHPSRRRTHKQIGRAHVLTPVTNAHLVCRLLLEKKKNKHNNPTPNNT